MTVSRSIYDTDRTKLNVRFNEQWIFITTQSLRIYLLNAKTANAIEYFVFFIEPIFLFENIF